MGGLTVSYLEHSGFAVETDTKVLVFDYYKDPAGIVNAYGAAKKPLWFFISHGHADHFNPRIADFSASTAYYVYNKDVPFTGGRPEQRRSMAVYEAIRLGDVQIKQYGSTDEGGSFLIRTDDYAIFHAGDLNRWHWDGDTGANIKEADELFERELKCLDGLVVDIAFFPVDARLERTREWGVTDFVNVVTVQRALIPMHYFGSPWTPSKAFLQTHGRVPLWIPQVAGETQVF